MAILKIKNENGEFINIPSIVGPKGEPGKSGTTNYNELTNIPIINLEGTSNNPIIYRNLEIGLYWVKGYIKIHNSSTLTNSQSKKLILVVQKTADHSKCIIFDRTASSHLCYIYDIKDNSSTYCNIQNESEKIGNLYYLTTTDKTSLVNAINEVNAQIGDINTILATLTEVSE